MADATQNVRGVFAYRSDIEFHLAPDIVGWDVEARDGHIGKVDAASFEDSSSCLVVDTGFWIFGKKRLVPAGVVERIDPDQQTVYVSMTKDEIKGAPDYDHERHRGDPMQYHEEHRRYYDPYTGLGM
jgi:hypothetical protein